jgi:AcrR family transcriptional regulator
MTFTTGSPKPPLQRRYQGVSPEDRQRLRREKLLEAATEIFGTRGFKHGTMRDICAHARLSDRYFYESFRNTEEIFDVVYNDMSKQLMQAMALSMAASATSPETIVKSGLKAFFQFIQDDPRRAQIMLVDAVHAGQYHAQAAQNGEDRPSNYNRVVTLLANAMRFDRFGGRISANLVAAGLVGMAIHTAIAWVQDGFQVSIEDILAHNYYAWKGMNQWTQECQTDMYPASGERRAKPREPESQVIEQMLSTFKPQG